MADFNNEKHAIVHDSEQAGIKSGREALANEALSYQKSAGNSNASEKVTQESSKIGNSSKDSLPGLVLEDSGKGMAMSAEKHSNEMHSDGSSKHSGEGKGSHAEHSAQKGQSNEHKDSGSTEANGSSQYSEKIMQKQSAENLAAQGIKGELKNSEAKQGAAENHVVEGMKGGSQQGAENQIADGSKNAAKQDAQNQIVDGIKGGAKQGAENQIADGIKNAAKQDAQNQIVDGIKGGAKQAAESQISDSIKNAAKQGAADGNSKSEAGDATKGGGGKDMENKSHREIFEKLKDALSQEKNFDKENLNKAMSGSHRLNNAKDD